MNENLLLGLLIGCVALLVIFTVLLVKAFVTIKSLSKEVRMHKNTLDQLYFNQIKTEERITKVDDRCEKFKGSLEVMSTMFGNVRNGLERRISTVEEQYSDELVKAVNSIVELVGVSCDHEPVDGAGSENRAVSGPNRGISEVCSEEAQEERLDTGDFDGDMVDIMADRDVKRKVLEEFAERPSDEKAVRLTVDGTTYSSTKGDEWSAVNGADTDGDFPCDEADVDDSGLKDVTYHWIFPSRDRDPELVFGQWYLVIGESKERTKEDGTPMLMSGDGMWNGHEFILSSDDRIDLDKVYALIKPPSSADIMEQIVSLALKKAG